jgi:deaminated glutathione amidase
MPAPKNPLKVALCQMTSTEDVAQNLKQMLGVIADLPSGVDLITFPENSLFMRLGKETKVPGLKLSDPCFHELQKTVDEMDAHMLVGSAPMDEGQNRPSNATVYLAPGQKPRIVYRKIHLFDVDVVGQSSVRESDSFNHGQTPQLLEIRSWRIGLSICYDLRFSELYSAYARQDAHILFIPSAFLVPTGRAHWHVLLRARAIESQTYVVAPAQAGEHLGSQGERRHTYGHSLVVDPWGEVLLDLGEMGPKAEIVEFSPTALEKVWRQIPQAQHRRLR